MEELIERKTSIRMNEKKDNRRITICSSIFFHCNITSKIIVFMAKESSNTKTPRNQKRHKGRLKGSLFFIFLCPPCPLCGLVLSTFFAASLHYDFFLKWRNLVQNF
jgi:hypothetical protein